MVKTAKQWYFIWFTLANRLLSITQFTQRNYDKLETVKIKMLDLIAKVIWRGSWGNCEISENIYFIIQLSYLSEFVGKIVDSAQSVRNYTNQHQYLERKYNTHDEYTLFT